MQSASEATQELTPACPSTQARCMFRLLARTWHGCIRCTHPQSGCFATEHAVCMSCITCMTCMTCSTVGLYGLTKQAQIKHCRYLAAYQLTASFARGRANSGAQTVSGICPEEAEPAPSTVSRAMASSRQQSPTAACVAAHLTQLCCSETQAQQGAQVL